MMLADAQKALEEGRITLMDLDAIHYFAEFLKATSGKSESERARIYLEYYPED